MGREGNISSRASSAISGMIIHQSRLLRFPVRGLMGAFSHSAAFTTGQRRLPCSRRTTMRTRMNCQISPAVRDRIKA